MSENSKHDREHGEKPRNVIVPLEGLEDKTYSLPERDESGHAGDAHHDDWVMVGETYDDKKKELYVTLSRYRGDDSIETRTVNNALFEHYQTKVDADRRFADARENLGASPVQMERIAMIRAIRNDPDNEKYAGLIPAEQEALEDIRKSNEKLRKESLSRLAGQRALQRTVNPMRFLIRKKHHQGRIEEE